ncbi:MAG: O-antigen ligase family protein [Pseudomonadota bacterium]|nr:O-antigen ligase family protein [Pseudomonadota bacterium]
MTTAASALPYSAPERSGVLGALVLRLDYFYLYVVMFTASGAVFRFGAVNTYLWYAIYLWTLARLCAELPALMRATVRNWAVFVWPLLALASVAWSLSPLASLQGGMQLLMTTIIAVFVGSRFPLNHILVAVTVVLSGAALASLALLYIGSPEMFAVSGGFEGVFAHKNTLGQRMNVLIAAALVLLTAQRWRLPLLAILGVAVYLLFLSKSATSQILGLLTPAALLALAFLRLDAKRATLGAIAGFGLAAASVMALFIASGDPISFILDSFGKDSTLTGRTWLWERGAEQIAQHPLIGGGYQAFWVDERSSEVLWIRHITLESVKGFHNVGIEVWNDLGLVGFAALIGVLLAYARRTFRYYRRTVSAAGLYPLFFLAIAVTCGAVNNAFFRQHELVHVLICAFFAATAAPPAPAQAAPVRARAPEKISP